jgi:type III secretory pathway lipoprotein EscJ
MIGKRCHRTLSAALVFAVELGAAGCGERTLLTGLARDEAQRCTVVLQAAGLDATMQADTSAAGGDALVVAVRGDEADYRTALETLEEHGLPRRATPGFTTETTGLIPSPAV